MPKRFGWIPNPPEVERFVATLDRPIFGLSAHELKDSGKGKVSLPFKALTQLLGSFPIHDQKIGDCVSHGYGISIDILKAVEIIVQGEAEEFFAETATEALYGFGRVEGLGRGQLGNEDGSLGAWQADAVKRFGTLARIKYEGADLTKYSGPLAKKWGKSGVPDILEPTAREHPVRTVSMVTTYEEARDAIANGYPVAVCSMQGFTEKRDAEGFAKASGQWAHCMAFIAADDESKRPGLLCQNSWGESWITGPKRHDQPEGSFWVDAETCNRMLRDRDSFAPSGFEGYPAQKLPEFWLG